VTLRIKKKTMVKKMNHFENQRDYLKESNQAVRSKGQAKKSIG
jgi:hypothetical protein